MRDADAVAPPRSGPPRYPAAPLIYALLAEKPSHPTVETVHEAVLAAMPTVSLRTVYQALHDLEAMDEIRLVQVGNGPFRVDTRPERHSHLRCTKCAAARRRRRPERARPPGRAAARLRRRGR